MVHSVWRCPCFNPHVLAETTDQGRQGSIRQVILDIAVGLQPHGIAPVTSKALGCNMYVISQVDHA